MTHSPFHFQEGYQIQIENRNKNCSHTEIDTLALKGLLNSVDFEILKLLGTYCYVNTHNLNSALTLKFMFTFLEHIGFHFLTSIYRNIRFEP